LAIFTLKRRRSIFPEGKLASDVQASWKGPGLRLTRRPSHQKLRSTLQRWAWCDSPRSRAFRALPGRAPMRVVGQLLRTSFHRQLKYPRGDFPSMVSLAFSIHVLDGTSVAVAEMQTRLGRFLEGRICLVFNNTAYSGMVGV
jgi:hypothetical protein